MPPAIERFVLGCSNFGGIGATPELFGRGEDEPVACALMDAAWELGIRWFDTADAYGGRSRRASPGSTPTPSTSTSRTTARP
jgi:aryl-alcohol dehydrogenase-like predicted oxidoreductase